MPALLEYSEALQAADRTLLVEGLRGASVETDQLGMPRPIAGASGVVFKVIANGSPYAVKCFTRYVADQHDRYNKISRALKSFDASWKVDFAYVSQGIRVGTSTYPVLRMAWVSGVNLAAFVDSHIDSPETIMGVARSFVAVVRDLEARGLAHGDLQHGNVLVLPSGELKLVDYDGMFVPELQGRLGTEVGHPNYQLPSRAMSDFGPGIDRFSAWLIFTSLVVIAHQPWLWSLLDCGDDRLMWGKADFQDPAQSGVFQHLAASGGKVDDVARLIQEFLSLPPARIPALDPGSVDLGSLPVGPRALVGSSPLVVDSPWRAEDFVQDGIGANWIASHLPPVPLRTFSLGWLVRIPFIVGVLTSLALTGTGVFFGLPGFTVAALAIVLLSILYGRISLNYDRTWRIRRSHTRAMKDIDRLRRPIRRSYEEAIHSARAAEKRAAEEVAKQRRAITEVVDRQAKALHAIRESSAKERTRLTERLKQLSVEEKATIQSELAALRTETVSRALRAIPIRGLRGIPSDVIANLHSHGFRTAADLVDYVLPGPYSGSSRVHLRNSTGSLVYVYGVGEKRARALLTWKRNHESRVVVPGSLATTRERQIRAKYQDETRALQQALSVIASRESADLAKTSAQHAAARSGLQAQLGKFQSDLESQRSQALTSVRGLKQRLEKEEQQAQMVKRQLEAFRRVTFPNYQAALLGLPDNWTFGPVVVLLLIVAGTAYMWAPELGQELFD